MSISLPERRQAPSPERIEQRHQELTEFLNNPEAMRAMRDALVGKARENLENNTELRSAGAYLAALRGLTGERIPGDEELRVLAELKGLFHEHLERGHDLLALAVAANVVNISGEKLLAGFPKEKQGLFQEQLRQLVKGDGKTLTAARGAANYRALFGEGALDQQKEKEIARVFDVPIARAFERRDLTHAGTYAAERKILLGENVVA